MRHFFLRLLVNAFALAVIITLLPQGIRLVGAEDQNELLTLFGIALVFGLVNAVVKPILTFLTCPFIFFTFGLFLLVINGVLFLIAADLSRLLPGGARLEVDGFGWAVVGALLMSVIGMVTDRLLGLNSKVRVKTVREVRYVTRDRDDDVVYFPPEDFDDKPKR